MRFDARTAEVLRKAARGPAAIALRQNRLLFGPNAVGPGSSALTKGGSVGVMVRLGGLPQLRRYPRAGGLAHNNIAAQNARLGALGQSPIVAAGATAGARYAGSAGGAALATSFGAAGSVVPVIGTVVGAVVGLLAAKAFAKHYLDVANINVAEDDEVAAYNKYQSIIGHFAGRQVGVPAMRAIWLGAQHSGLFPLAANAPRQCFHNGCLKYGGRPDWVDSVLNHYGGDNNPAPNTFADVFKLWVAHRPVPGVAAPTFVTPPTVMPPVVRAPIMRAPALQLRGLGVLGQMSTPASVVDFVDNYFIPANKVHSNPPWAVPTNATEHQILYDMADAWLATQPVQTVAYIATQPQAAPAPAVLPQPINIVPSRTGAGGASQQVPGYYMFNPTGFNGQPLYMTIADANAPMQGQTVTTYAMVNGQMVAVGTTTLSAGAVTGPVMPIQLPGAGGGAPYGGGPYPLPQVPGPMPNQPATPALTAAAAPGGGGGLLTALLAAFALTR
jgi:hypothetical protein